MLTIRDAKPSDAPFLAECILAGMHFYDFEDVLSDDVTVFLRITSVGAVFSREKAPRQFHSEYDPQDNGYGYFSGRKAE